MNTTSETPLLNGMNNVPISSNNINLSNGRPLLANTTDPVQPQFKRAGIVGRIKNMFKALPHEERRFEKLKEAIYDNNIDEIKRLLATGVNVNNPIDGYGYYGYEGYTLLHFAAERNKYVVVELLLAAGANPNIADKIGSRMPIHYAAIRNFPDIIKLLVEAGASIEVKDSNGFTPLENAIYYNSINAVQILLEAGANPNTVNKYGQTPLYLSLNNIDIAKLLLDAGANTEAKDIQGKTLLDYLKDGHNPELRALLEKTKGGSRKSRKSKKNKKRKTRRS